MDFLSREDLYGISIAVIIHSLDPSLFTQLILSSRLITHCSFV